MTTLAAAPAAVKPITARDLVRARYFGLTLPAAPAAELAPEIEPTANPRDSWPAWTDADTWTTEDDDEPRPTADESYAPGELDEAEWTGMSLRLAGEPMGELVGTNSTALLLRFAIGQMAGLDARQEAERLERERVEHDRDYCRWLDRIAEDLAAPGPRETDGYPAGYCS